MNFKKYKRFFSFGCSMTRYHWPTWADAVGQEIPEYYNYAMSGGGNLFISSSIAEANQRHTFNSDDLVMIMWSTVYREDRYVNNNWLIPGNIFSQDAYDEAFIKKYIDSRGQLIRDLSLISLSQGLLDSIKVDHYMFTMEPMHIVPSPYLKGEQTYHDVLDLFKSTIDRLGPDMLTFGCNGVWNQLPIRDDSTPTGQTHDYHPAPLQHFNFIRKALPEIEWQSSTIDFVKHYDELVTTSRKFSDINYQTPWPTRL